MANDQTVAPVIIKRKKIIAADGHHGGAWKVAYADFLTAMMAFFMLMWLLNATTEQQKKGIADYFSPTLAINRSSGGGDSSFIGDTVFTEEILTRQGVSASTKIINALTPSSTAGGTSTTKKSTVSADFETFLKMLTAQIQNQDPMNPIDSSDYATQLATFSSVEQQVLANSYLENIKSVLSNSSLASVADWIGKSAKVEGKLWFDGDPVKLEFELPFDATRAELVVQTQTGNEVFRANVDPEDRTLHWSGTQSNGANVEHGSYKAILVPYNEDDPLKNMPFYSFQN